MIESSQLMKKALKAVQKDLITIIAYVNYKKNKGIISCGFFFSIVVLQWHLLTFFSLLLWLCFSFLDQKYLVINFSQYFLLFA